MDKAEGDDGSDLLSKFGDALGDFATAMSLADSPSDWLHASLKHTHTTAQSLPELLDDHGLNDLENITMIYPVRPFHTDNHN